MAGLHAYCWRDTHDNDILHFGVGPDPKRVTYWFSCPEDGINDVFDPLSVMEAVHLTTTPRRVTLSLGVIREKT